MRWISSTTYNIMRPIKGKLIYKLITKQDGQIVLPETAKNRSVSSLVVAVNDPTSGIFPNDIILHNMKYNGRVEHFFVDSEDHKIMNTDDVYARVVAGNIIPIKDWIFCKMIIPDSIIAGAFKLSDCKEVQLAAISIVGDKGLPLAIGKKYLINGWDTDMQQFQFGNDSYVFLKAHHLVAEVQHNEPENVIPLFTN